MADVQVDANLFRQRVRHLWHRWQTDAKLLDKKSIVIYVNDPSDTTLTYSVVLQRWLFNYEFRSTIFVITDKEFICLTSQKKVNFLAPLLGSSDDDNHSPKVVLLARNRHNESDNYKILMNAISKSRQGNQIGTFFKDLPVGSFIEDFDSQIATTYRKEGIDSILSQVMLVKDQSEIESMNCVAKVISFLYKQTKDQIYEWIESMKKGKDSELCDFLKKLTASEKFQQIPKSDYFEFCIDPKIISGGKNMELDYSSQSPNKRTLLNSIVCYFQGRIDFYCCTLARTILINPTKSKEDNYKFAVDFHNHVISLAEPKKQLGDIYRKAITFVEERRPDLLENITHCFGTSSGIHPNNKLVQIVANSEVVLPQSFTLQISVMFRDLCAEDESNSNMKYYSILLVDTIAYKDGNMSLVTKNSKQIEYISISHNDPNEGGESDNSEYLDNYLNQANVDINSRRILRKPAIFKDKAQLLNHQRELKQELYLKANDKLRSLSPKSDEAKAFQTPVSYESYEKIPKNQQTKNNQIFCDKQSLSILFPINCQIYPVHVSKIKNLNVSTSPDERHCTLRVNFNCPMSIYKSFEEQQIYHLREIHYTAKNYRDTQIDSIPSTFLHQAANDIKELQKFSKKAVNQRDEVQNTSGIKLQPFENGPRVILRDVVIRPHMASRTPGNLEAYKNGFLYTKQNGDRFILPYSLIDISVYHPCSDTSLIIALHFKLSKFVAIGAKKSEYVQFYCEAGELSSDLEQSSSSKRRKNDNYDEDRDEEITIQNKKRLRALFAKYCQQVEEQTNSLINFERPLPHQIFTANPNRSSSEISISENYFISVIDWPPFILNLNEIELVYFERDIEGLTTCDMAIIFKDYYRKVTFLRSILKEHMHLVQTTLDKHNIPYFSGIQALNWQKIMQTILEDPIGFAESDNWKFLSLDTSDDEDASSSEEESSSQEEETGSESSDEESDDEDDEESDEDDAASDSDDSEEEYSDEDDD